MKIRSLKCTELEDFCEIISDDMSPGDLLDLIEANTEIKQLESENLYLEANYILFLLEEKLGLDLKEFESINLNTDDLIVRVKPYMMHDYD